MISPPESHGLEGSQRGNDDKALGHEPRRSIYRKPMTQASGQRRERASGALGRSRRIQPVQRDLAHLRLAGLDVRAQQAPRLVAAAADHGAQDLGVLVIGLVDAIRLGEVEPADDAYPLAHLVMAA